jgi:hypothetical protein
MTEDEQKLLSTDSRGKKAKTKPNAEDVAMALNQRKEWVTDGAIADVTMLIQKRNDLGNAILSEYDQRQADFFDSIEIEIPQLFEVITA